MKTNNHEVIFAIVNSGFAEDVMDVAREQGARGGTILTGRGVAKEEAAAFFKDQKSAKETADIIQNRVQIYVNENR